MDGYQRCREVFVAWHERARRGDVHGLLALYAPDALFESPLVPAIFDDLKSGVLRGHEAIGEFLAEGTRRRPNVLVRWHRSGECLCDGRTLFWEYPRETPDGEQIDIAEVMEIDDHGLIRRHRIYWGWLGVAELTRATLAKTSR
jgi:ketosteroid isomerase-like protein